MIENIINSNFLFFVFKNVFIYDIDYASNVDTCSFAASKAGNAFFNYSYASSANF